MFERRVTKAGAEAQAARRAPLEDETVEVAQGERGTEGRGSQGDGDEEEVLAGPQSLVAGLGAEAAGIDGDPLPQGRARRRRAARALGDQARGRRRVRELARGTAEGVGAEPLGPGVQRGMSRRVPAHVGPDHLAERVPPVVEPGGLLDDLEAELLACEDITRQDPRPLATLRTARDGERQPGGDHGETPRRPSPASRPVAVRETS